MRPSGDLWMLLLDLHNMYKVAFPSCPSPVTWDDAAALRRPARTCPLGACGSPPLTSTSLYECKAKPRALHCSTHTKKSNPSQEGTGSQNNEHTFSLSEWSFSFAPISMSRGCFFLFCLWVSQIVQERRAHFVWSIWPGNPDRTVRHKLCAGDVTKKFPESWMRQVWKVLFNNKL